VGHLDGALAKGGLFAIVRDGADGDAQPAVDPGLDTLERVKLEGKADCVVSDLDRVCGRRAVTRSTRSSSARRAAMRS
jgi:hypothetical protein